MSHDHSPTTPSSGVNILPQHHNHNGEGSHLAPTYSTHKEGAPFDSRISRVGAGDLGHQAKTIEPTGFYKHVGNPGLTGLAVHSVTLMSLAVVFMGFRGVALPNYAVGNLWFCAGLYMLVVHIFCLIKGETFSATVFAVFSAFYLSYAAILTPAFGAAAAYTDAVELNNALGMYLFVWNGAFMCIFICSLRTNLALVGVFFGVIMGVFLLAGSYLEMAKLLGKGLATSSTYTALTKGGGAFLFFSACCGFYLVLVQMFESVDMPFKLPVGSLDRFWPKKKQS